MLNNIKTVFRYDAGSRGFRKAAVFLFILAFSLFVFGLFWIKSLF